MDLARRRSSLGAGTSGRASAAMMPVAARVPACRTPSCTRCLQPAAPAAAHGASAKPSRARTVLCRAEKKEYYNYKDMPPLPLTVIKIHIPELGLTVVDEASKPNRMASLAIFYDIHKDDQYRSVLSRKSALTALCMYDKDDVEAAQRTPGDYPNVDLLLRVYAQGLELKLEVDEFMPK